MSGMQHRPPEVLFFPMVWDLICVCLYHKGCNEVGELAGSYIMFCFSAFFVWLLLASRARRFFTGGSGRGEERENEKSPGSRG